MQNDEKGAVRALWLRSAAIGFLAMRALPIAAVSAGWSLSASLGVTAGELLAIVIFALGCGVMMTARQTGDVRIWCGIRAAAAVIYIIASEMTGRWQAGSGGDAVRSIFTAVDSIIVAAALLAGASPVKLLGGIAAVVSAAVMISQIDSAAEISSMLLPLAGALTAGGAISCASSEQKISGTAATAGMIAAMIIDMLK